MCQWQMFDWIHFDQFIADDETKVFHGGDVEGTFGKFDRKTVFAKVLEEVACLFVMEFEGTSGVESQVIHVDFEPAFSDHVSENMVHEGLKSAGGIAESEEHDSWFKKSKRGDEHSFPLIFLTNADIVVTPANVEFSEVSGVLHVINKFRDKRQWVSVMNGVGIKITIVLTGVKAAVFLWNKEEGQCLR